MHPDIYKRPLLFVLLFLIVVIGLFYHSSPTQQDIYHFISRQSVTLTGRVEYFYTAKSASNNVIVKVKTVDGQPASGYVYARLISFEPLWKDTLEIKGVLQEPYGTDLIGNFNWRKYLAGKHVFTEIKGEEVRVLKRASWPYRVIRWIRADILRVLSEKIPPPLDLVASGILLGERGEMPIPLLTAFQDSGAIHLLVASGGNVGFVTVLVFAFCAVCGIQRKKSVFLALIIAGFYTVLAGADAPLMRAYFMTVCAGIGYYMGRNSGAWQGLVVSCVCILLKSPASLFETGFQMSFLATAALLIGLSNYPVPRKWPRTTRFFAQIFIATLAIQLALLPIFTNVFYKISVTGLIANMLLVPLASLLLALCFAYYIGCVLHIGVVLYYPTVWGLTIFRNLVVFFAAFKLSAIPVAAWGVGTIIAYYAGLFGIFHLPQKQFIRKIIVPILLLMIGSLVWQQIQSRTSRIYVLDEWYKNEVIIRTKDGHVFLVGEDLPNDKMAKALRKIGHMKADAVFLTRYVATHCKENPLSSVVVCPFETAWPHENTWKFGQTSIRIIWGLHETKNGRIWQNAGYSGTKQDDVSYCFTIGDESEFCVGAQARFVRTSDHAIDPVLNQTVQERI